MKKHLTFKDDKSDKFWSIEINGNSFTVTYGKAGTDGTSQTKSFDSTDECIKEAEALMNQNLLEGFENISWYVLDIDYNKPIIATISFPEICSDNDLIFLRRKDNINIKSPVIVFDEYRGNRKNYPDYFDGGHGRIISNKFLKIISDLNITTVQTYPAVIKTRKDKKTIVDEGIHHVINVTATISCIDIERSECVFSNGNVFRVIKMFVDETKIPEGIEIFIPQEWDRVFFVSERMAELLIKNKIKGISLLPWHLWKNMDY